jgi:hypothetical protein
MRCAKECFVDQGGHDNKHPFKAFNFTRLGETTMHGHQVYFLKASPRPGYQPPNMEAQALTGMQGKLWMDKETFQWVRVEAQVVRPVSIEGCLAQVEPGTRFELEKTAVAPPFGSPRTFQCRRGPRSYSSSPRTIRRITSTSTTANGHRTAIQGRHTRRPNACLMIKGLFCRPIPSTGLL